MGRFISLLSYGYTVIWGDPNITHLINHVNPLYHDTTRLVKQGT
jgi:hypothetical protein